MVSKKKCFKFLAPFLLLLSIFSVFGLEVDAAGEYEAYGNEIKPPQGENYDGDHGLYVRGKNDPGIGEVVYCYNRHKSLPDTYVGILLGRKGYLLSLK